MTRRGWSLVEMMVALGLMSIVMAIVAMTFIRTNRFSMGQNQRAAIQGSIQQISKELESVLQRTCNDGISWQPAGVQPALLGIHCLQDGSSVPNLRYENVYHCYLWDKANQRLTSTICPPGPGSPSAPPTDRPQKLAPAQITALVNAGPGTKLLAEGVSNFDVTFVSGPLVRFTVEIKRAIPGQAGFDKRQITKDLTLRNRYRP